MTPTKKEELQEKMGGCVSILGHFGITVWSSGGGNQEKEIQTLVFYRLSAASHDAYCLPLMQAFMEENPDIVIEDVVVTSGGYEALASKVLLANAAGTPPDVAMTGYSLIKTMVESGNAVDLTPFMAKDAKFDAKGLFPAMVDLGKFDGKQYLIRSAPVLRSCCLTRICLPRSVWTRLIRQNHGLKRRLLLRNLKMPAIWESYGVGRSPETGYSRR